jgi:hypothetical protein
VQHETQNVDPVMQAVNRFPPHLLVRRLDHEEIDSFPFMRPSPGEITSWSNDDDFADAFFRGLFVECPPSFHRLDEFQIDRGWVAEAEPKAMFAGMLAGAQGWDPSHNVPDHIQRSLDEARRSLDIANYRSSVRCHAEP